MGKHICMEAEFLSKYVSNRKNIIPLWVKNMLNRTLIHLLILFLIYITLFLTLKQVLNIIITIKQAKANMKPHHLGLKFFALLTMLTSLISSKKLIPSMICKVKRKNSDLLVRTYFYSICLTVWKILNFIIYLKNLAIFFQLVSWQKKMESQKVSAL
jgi:hypothetical protein